MGSDSSYYHLCVPYYNEIPTQGVIVGENNESIEEEDNREDEEFISSLSISVDKG